jgi:uncharacterized protein
VIPLGTVEAVHTAQRRAAPWPYRELDLTRLRAEGWRPTPVHDLVLKVHQRCNLACDYCFVYTKSDQTWRERPAAMSDVVRRAAVASLGRHVRRHGLTSVRVILHGGEPLLYGVDRLGRMAAEVRAAMPTGCAVEIGMQSNGVLLDAMVLRQLVQHQIRIGISVDGVASHHDRHRVTPTGKGTFAAVAEALDLLRRPENRPSYAGVLCTIAPDTDPIACYDQLRAFDPPMIDFLLPHAHWGSPPWRPPGSPTPYADWLIAVFDRWHGESGPIRVRLFEDIITLLLGGSGSSEQVGLSPSAVIVVESDGTIEQVDSLKSAYPGACATGLHIERDELDATSDDPGVVARQIGGAALSAQCLACPIHKVCGAGHYVHRYRPDAGFHNPSVYCADMKVLIGHIRHRMEAEISSRTTESAGAR